MAAADTDEGRTALVAVACSVADGSFGAASGGCRLSVAGARFIALKRDPQGAKIRPIAIGECWRRFAAQSHVRRQRQRRRELVRKSVFT